MAYEFQKKGWDGSKRKVKIRCHFGGMVHWVSFCVAFFTVSSIISTRRSMSSISGSALPGVLDGGGKGRAGSPKRRNSALSVFISRQWCSHRSSPVLLKAAFSAASSLAFTRSSCNMIFQIIPDNSASACFKFDMMRGRKELGRCGDFSVCVKFSRVRLFEVVIPILCQVSLAFSLLERAE